MDNLDTRMQFAADLLPSMRRARATRDWSGLIKLIDDASANLEIIRAVANEMQSLNATKPEGRKRNYSGRDGMRTQYVKKYLKDLGPGGIVDIPIFPGQDKKVFGRLVSACCFKAWGRGSHTMETKAKSITIMRTK